MRVAAYIRVSTDEQAERGNSLNEQQERLEAYCKAMGWPKPNIYPDDGYSAGTLKRPFLEKLLKDIEENKIDVLLTTKLDRLTRSLFDLLQLIKFMESNKCNFVSATENFDTTTAAGRMVLQLLGVFAEFERGRTSERVQDNMISLAKNTDIALSRPCFGYDVIDRRYEINEEEAKHVRHMFDLAENGHGTRTIAKELNANNVLTKQGKLWDSTNVRRILTNETIAGMRIHNKRKKVNGKTVIRPKDEWIIKKDNHPTIIELERFERIQSILDSRKRNKRHAESETYLLTGLLKCGHCGTNMKGSTSRINRADKHYIYHRYICASYTLNYSCKHHFAHRDELESDVINMIKQIADTSSSELTIRITSKSKTDEIKETELLLDRLNKQMQRQIEAHSKGLIEDEDLKASTDRVKEERQLLRSKLEKLKSDKGDTDTVKKNIQDLIDDITSVDRLKAKTGIMKLIDSLVLKDNNIDVIWRA
ncbi:recombinase family protein [Psychrobacillus sp. FJAT-21963]|uniref:recombinase family protein n=1 Tax=Psychrobacillus sp. FJAT-21963 TaxID=1712028 RepID=UPI0006FCF169|nr:recombinase family protein [Psychrobacillus sp. FJAT-21963]KQL37165.1 site-specific recombinase [Psychrobacillus sp. FJAT-21963]